MAVPVFVWTRCSGAACPSPTSVFPLHSSGLGGMAAGGLLGVWVGELCEAHLTVA